jgi:pilus assembly protein CpaB
LILIAAIAVGALAAFAIFNYVQGIEDRANEDVERVAVVQITQPIPRGLTGQEALDQGYFDLDAAIAQEFRPPSALRPDQISLIVDKIAATDLVENQILLEDMFVDPSNSLITNARRIATGRVAITISVDNIRGVAGLIVPGDFVNMMAIPTGGGDCVAEATDGDAEVPEGTAPTDTAIFCSPARMVYQGVQVLFVDRSPVPLPGEQTAADGTAVAPANTGLLTLSVPPEAAQRIASVSQEQWYLTLLPTDYDPAALPPFDPTVPLLPGEDAAVLTPYGPEGAPPEDTP